MMHDLQPSSQPIQQPTTPSWRQAVDNPWLMLFTLFFVTAALGLPFLWMSRGFSTLGKIAVTIAVLAWTALILWLFWLVMAWTVPTIWHSLKDIFGT
jgi:hypothetical protein